MELRLRFLILLLRLPENTREEKFSQYELGKEKHRQKSERNPALSFRLYAGILLLCHSELVWESHPISKNSPEWASFLIIKVELSYQFGAGGGASLFRES